MAANVRDRATLAAILVMAGTLQDGKSRERIEAAVREETAPEEERRKVEAAVLTRQEAATVLACGLRTLDGLANRGKLVRVFYSDGKRARGYTRASVEALAGAM